MGRILVVVLGLGVVLGGVWYSLKRTQGASAEVGRSAPAQQLDNVREAARGIEADAQRRADELLPKSTDE